MSQSFDTTDATPAGDMSASQFREAAARAVDMVARYLEDPAVWPVLSPHEPGHLRRALPDHAPERGEPMEALLADFEQLILPHTTHWNHPGFMAYFGITGSGPGVIAELLTAALNVNAMVWRSGPAQTELEEVALGWLRRLMGLTDDAWDGTINDTASISTMHALAAAREAVPALDARQRGLAGRPEVPPLRVYCSAEAHSSVDKAAVTLGMGLDGVRRIRTDDRMALDVAALERAIAEDRAAGTLPVAVVATVGTTSVTAVDPVAAIADVCDREGLWLHVDAAYGGVAALLPEMRHVLDGCDRADSLVVNPHKWLFVPVDCSVLYTRRPDMLRRAFSLVPAYLETPGTGDARNLMDYGLALGRRFRALKLWFVLRWFGAEGIRERLREHLRLARLLAERVDADRRWERLAPVDFSVVVFRLRPQGTSAAHVGDALEASTPGGEAADAVNTATDAMSATTDAMSAATDAMNAAVIERVNASGEVFLAQTRVRDRLAIRVAIGNLRTTESHVLRAWELLCDAAAAVAQPPSVM